jgi:hypothetical protein
LLIPCIFFSMYSAYCTNQMHGSKYARIMSWLCVGDTPSIFVCIEYRSRRIHTYLTLCSWHCVYREFCGYLQHITNKCTIYLIHNCIEKLVHVLMDCILTGNKL